MSQHLCCAFWQRRRPLREGFVDTTDPTLSFATPRGGLGAAAFRDQPILRR